MSSLFIVSREKYFIFSFVIGHTTKNVLYLTYLILAAAFSGNGEQWRDCLFTYLMFKCEDLKILLCFFRLIINNSASHYGLYFTAFYIFHSSFLNIIRQLYNKIFIYLCFNMHLKIKNAVRSSFLSIIAFTLKYFPFSPCFSILKCKIQSLGHKL